MSHVSGHAEMIVFFALEIAITQKFAGLHNLAVLGCQTEVC